MAEKPDECVYCGGRPLSREHVLPKWIFKTPEVRQILKDHPYSPQVKVMFSHAVDFALKTAVIRPEIRGMTLGCMTLWCVLFAHLVMRVGCRRLKRRLCR